MSGGEPDRTVEARYSLAETPTEDDVLITRALLHCTYGSQSRYGSDGVSSFDSCSSDEIVRLMELPDNWREDEEISFVLIEPEHDIQGLIDSDVDLGTYSIEQPDAETGESTVVIRHHIADFGGLMAELSESDAAVAVAEEEAEEDYEPRPDCEGRVRPPWSGFVEPDVEDPADE